MQLRLTLAVLLIALSAVLATPVPVEDIPPGCSDDAGDYSC